jgi:CHAT domain-containing protein
VHEHRIELRAVSYARVTVEQAAIDVALELRGPDGAVLARVDSPGGHRVPELLSWVAPAAGVYRLLIRAHDPQAPRDTYTLGLDEVRPAAAGDEARVAVERAAADARQRSFSERVEDKRKALEDLEQVLAAWRAAGDRLGEARTLNDRGDLQARLGDNEGALASLPQALEIARALGDRREQARALNLLGLVQRRMGVDRARVLELYSASLRLWREVGDRVGEQDVLYNLGVLNADMGDSAAAFGDYRQALELSRAARQPAGQAFALAAIGLIQRDRGDTAGALDCFTQGIDLARRSGDRSAEAYLLYSTGSFHLHRGELQPAIELFTEALGLYRAQGDRIQEARVLTSLGSANVSLGDLDRALDCYRRAQEIHHADHDRTGELYTLLYLGWVRQLQGESEEAARQYSAALAIGRSLDSPLELARALYFLGGGELALGRAGDAAGALTESMQVLTGHGRSHPFDEARILLELGRASHALGEDGQAERQLRQALGFGRTLQSFTIETMAEGYLARLELDRGDLPAARAAIEEVLRIVDSVRSRVASQRLRVLFLASRQAYYQLHLEILMRLHERDPAGGYLPEALAASERARARGLLDLLAEGRIDVRRGISADLKQREEEIDNRISTLQARMLDDLTKGGWDAAKATHLDEEVKQAAVDREELEWEIRRRHPRYAAVRNPAPLRLEEIQALLDDRTALLEYAVGEERSFLFVVTREGLASYALPAASRLADEVRRLGGALGTPGRRSFGLYVTLARSLYRELLSPAAGILAHKPRLIVAPDGPLHVLSFEALLTGDPGAEQGFATLPYLIRGKSVTYVPSASVLAELGRPRERTPTPAVAKRFIGFADARPASLPRLAQSRREVEGIASLYAPDESRLYLDLAATEENVKDNELLKAARRLHFATHGFLNEKQPELSGLALSRSPGSDGLLQVYEMFNLELDADLVVLSACDTGLGAAVSGEGLVGVTRALLYAGARSVVVSLWPVDDASTPGLMISFYRHLDRDEDKAESLRLAKLEMIGEGKFSQPFYWAPFILIGEPK